jgi:hypothetical protein
VVVFGFSWLARKVMIDPLGTLLRKLLSRWRLLGGDNTHLAVTFVSLEVSQAFGFLYAWKQLRSFMFKYGSP